MATQIGIRVFKKGYKVEKVWIWEELKREQEGKYDQNTLYIYIGQSQKINENTVLN